MVSVLSVVAFLSGGVWTFLLSSDVAKDAYRNLQLFAKVYDIVKRQYVDEPKDEALVQGAIRGMLDSLDPHSAYYTKEEFAEMQTDTKGQFGGIGIEIVKRNGLLTVVAPIEDTPAFNAGIKSGDVIAKIGDQITEKMSSFDAVKVMRGKPGSAIELWIRREGVDNLIPFKIKRAIINVKSVSSRVVENIPVVKIKSFQERSGEDLRKALKELSKGKPIPGLVLDLRNDPGGLLQQAVEVADTFLEKGLIVYMQGRDKVPTDKKFAVAKGTEPNYPLVVLINGGSASASEIVAGALQDQKRATIMGTQSFGKGSVQNVMSLDDGGGIKLTVALYYTPSGRTIQGLGITPDKEVKNIQDTDPLIRERDLPGHIVGKEEGKNDPKKDKKAESSVALDKLTPLQKEDMQLATAIDFIKKQATQGAATAEKK